VDFLLISKRNSVLVGNRNIMKQHLIRKWIHIGFFTVGTINGVSHLYGNDDDLPPQPIHEGSCWGHLFDGTPFYKSRQRGFCTASGQKVVNVNSSWLREFNFTHFTDEDRIYITMYFGSHNEALDEHDVQFPIIGYHRADNKPIFLHRASGLCIFGDPWPNQVATRDALAPDVIFTDGSVPIELPVHPILGQVVGHMMVNRGHCVPIFHSPQGRFVTENGYTVVNVNGTYMREIVPGRLLLDLSTSRSYNGNGHGPLPDRYAGTIGEDNTLYNSNGVFYTLIENRIEIYTPNGNQWTLVKCELFY
jgi:hypothetical protein